MSLLKNSDFEDSTKAPWTELNFFQAVTFSTGPAPIALTGKNIGSVLTSSPNGSIAQDVLDVSASHISAFVFVRSSTGQPISGSLAIWNLSVVPNKASSTPFTVSNTLDWELVTNSFDVGPGIKRIRVELYVSTVFAPLLIDQFNAF